jgi:hypothetical protein
MSRLLHKARAGNPALAVSTDFDAGWSSPVARQAHNLKVVGSNPTPATKQKARHVNTLAGFIMCGFGQNRVKRVLPRNAIKINAFSSHVTPCWRVRITWMAHEQRPSVHQPFRDLLDMV